MKHIYLIKKTWIVFFSLVIVLGTTKRAFSQLIYQPYSYQFYQKLDAAVYSTASGSHTSLKPYLMVDSDALRIAYNALMTPDSASTTHKGWIYRKIFNEHLFDEHTKDYTFYLDYLTDLQVGREFTDKKMTSLNTRGYQIGGTIGAHFFFYTSGYENQGEFPNYENTYIHTIGMIPGQAYLRSFNGKPDWSYVRTLAGYAPSKYVTIALGEDKTFIGDGYRSILLSDYAAAYPLLRVTFNWGKNVQYMAMWAYMEDQKAVQFNAFTNNRRKWGAFHYIDWTITNRASIGFFNALITEEANDKGIGHGFDVNYVDPLLFSSSFGPSGTTPDHTLLGFNGKYKLLDKTTLYGQFLYDQAVATADNSKTAWQVGFRGSDLFQINRLHYLFEYNTAAPYTYADKYPIVNYTELSEPLADPLGGNFKEWLGIINYSLGKFDFQGQLDYSKYGLNTNGVNYGKDILVANDLNIPSGSYATGQGLATTLKYAEGTASYLINPKTNLRFELGGLLRQEKNSQVDNKTAMITFGLRSSFRNLYHDF